MQFVEQQKNIDRSSALYSFEGPFQLSHIDTADIRFPAKSVQPKYCLAFVDLFTCKTYSYPMRNRSLLNKKIAFFMMKMARNKTNGQRNEDTDR